MKKEIKKHEKKEIRDRLYVGYVDSSTLFSGSLKDVANNVLALEQKILSENKNIAANNYIRFEMKTDVEYDYGNASLGIEFYGIKMETDAEFTKRIEKSERMAEAQRLSAIKRKDANEKRKRTLYLKLKAEYENIDTLK